MVLDVKQVGELMRVSVEAPEGVNFRMLLDVKLVDELMRISIEAFNGCQRPYAPRFKAG